MYSILYFQKYGICTNTKYTSHSPHYLHTTVTGWTKLSKQVVLWCMFTETDSTTSGWFEVQNKIYKHFNNSHKNFVTSQNPRNSGTVHKRHNEITGNLWRRVVILLNVLTVETLKHLSFVCLCHLRQFKHRLLKPKL